MVHPQPFKDGGLFVQYASTIVWLPDRLLNTIIAEAENHYDLETGGAFMGYWAGEQAVITAVIEAGPLAIHSRCSFEPDYGWQQKRIAEHYAVSGRRETYLGDWHTHPGGISGTLSGQDRRALRGIASSKAARASRPISMIVFGTPQQWGIAIWCAALLPRKILWDRLLTWRANLRLHDDRS